MRRLYSRLPRMVATQADRPTTAWPKTAGSSARAAPQRPAPDQPCGTLMAGKAQPPPGLDDVFARLQAQLEARHFKRALKSCDEGAQAPCAGLAAARPAWADPGPPAQS